jgi:hypothetical protein
MFLEIESIYNFIIVINVSLILKKKMISNSVSHITIKLELYNIDNTNTML